jgi:serine protease Do
VVVKPVSPTLMTASSLNSTRRALPRNQIIFACALVAALAGFSVAASAAASHERAQGYLGVEFHDTTDEVISTLHLQGPRGAEIVMVDHDGPAGNAGLQPHDIVLQVNGQNIENAEELRRKIHDASPGAGVSLSIVRQGRAMTVTAKLGNREEVERLAWQHMALPDTPQGSDDVPNVLADRNSSEGTPSRSHGQSFIGSVLHAGPYTGASLEAMEPQLAGFFGAPPKTGLLVHGVDADSPAAVSGLRAGDVVIRMDSTTVASTSDWTKYVRANKGKAVTLTILRDKHEMTLTLTPDLKRHSSVQMPKGPETSSTAWS